MKADSMTMDRKLMRGLGQIGFIIVFVLVARWGVVTYRQTRRTTCLGLSGGPSNSQWRWEGPTDYSVFVKPAGTIKAAMLFAKFPDAETVESTQDLYNRLVPDAAQFFKRASYGKMELLVDPHHRWIQMDQPSTSYDCSRWNTHKIYVAEVVHKAAKDVKFGEYNLVYVVASLNKGTPSSPAWVVRPGDGVRLDNAEVRHAVTFGNDIRIVSDGWQTLVHETGHVFGLPDLYDYARGPDLYRWVGIWDPMSWHGISSEYLAWHKYKLGWLSDQDFVVVSSGAWTGAIVPIEKEQGIKGVVAPIGDSDAYVLEVRNRPIQPGSEYGVLCSRVALSRQEGNGQIVIVSGKANDGVDNALFFKGKIPTKDVNIEIKGREGTAFIVSVTR